MKSDDSERPVFYSNKCPVCDGPMHEELVMNALSRRDNATYICSDCGLQEAMSDFGRFFTGGER
jgi:predicted RNA-binding Zn-ribbon protein involved in translation (DUF1610 family)